MPVLRIQHSVPAYEAWKRAFDADPLDRKGSGVRRWQVHRTLSAPTLVMIDLEFDDTAAAERFQERLRGLWSGPGKAVMQNPEAWIIESVESGTL